MNPRWLYIQSFMRSQNLIGAINTFSIHVKLVLAGHCDENREEAAASARQTLARFLRSISGIAEKAQSPQGGAILGVDPRLSRLVSAIATQHGQCTAVASPLSPSRLSGLANVLERGTETADQTTLESLALLRALLEEHAYVDGQQVLGEI